MSEIDFFINILKSYYKVHSEAGLRAHLLPLESKISYWVSQLNYDIYQSNKGYPIGKVMKAPELEYELKMIVKDAGEFLELFEDQPTICLTHDLDYLTPTVPLILKTLIGRRQWLGSIGKKQFLSSIKSYLDFEKDFFGGETPSTFFIPSVMRSKSLKRRLIQKIIDPSYTTLSPEFSELKKLIKAYGPDVGIHGSFFSTLDNSLRDERETLEKALEQEVIMARQHWLHIPSESSLETLVESGVRYDSTLGWNGSMGFRCGLSRPFSVPLQSGRLIEIPLLIMDGVLFDELGLNEEEAFKVCTEYLKVVFKAKGAVAINWHGRTFAEPYNWGSLYKRIVTWAKAEGFMFESLKNIGKAYNERLQ